MSKIKVELTKPQLVILKNAMTYYASGGDIQDESASYNRAMKRLWGKLVKLYLEAK